MPLPQFQSAVAELFTPPRYHTAEEQAGCNVDLNDY